MTNPIEFFQDQTLGNDGDGDSAVATDAARQAQAHAAMAAAHSYLAENAGEGVAPVDERGPDGA